MERWIVIGIPILFLMGSLLHFLFDFTGGNPIVGAFVPVNESVWEHLKMVPIPVMLWWIIYYAIRGGTYQIKPNQWFAGALVAILSAILTIPLLYYFYTEAFGVEYVLIDVLILLVAIIIGQLLGLYVYRTTNGVPYILSLILIVGILFVFAFFTYHPPKIPLFKDPTSGQYGLVK